MNKLVIENNGTQVPVAELEIISAKQQLLLGDVNRDLILRTAGSISIQVGNKFYDLPFTQDSGDTVITDTGSSTLILNNTSDLLDNTPTEGTLVYVRESQILYLYIDGAYVKLISTKSGSVYADLSAFEELGGDQRYTLQLYLGLTLAKLDDVLTYNFDQFYPGQSIFFILEGKHFRHIYGTDPRNPANWQEIYLSIDGGTVLGDVGIGKERDPNYKLAVKGKASFDDAVTLRDGFVNTNYRAGMDGAGYRLYSDFTGKWTLDLDRLTIRHSMSTPGFVSGFSGFGFRLDVENSHLIIDNLTVRKQMKVYELVISQIRASNGSIWVSDAAKISQVEIVTNGYKCYIDTDEGTIIQPFRVNDIIRCQKWNGKDVKYYSSSVVEIDNSGEWFTISMDDEHEGDGVPEVGDDVVRIGNKTDTNRQGAIYLTSSDDYAPYIDVIDGVTSPDFTNKTRARLGKLSGITDPVLGQLEGYGLYSDNVYLKGKFVVTGPGGNVATKDDLANIVVGGSNLILNSNFTFGDKHWSTNGGQQVYGDKVIYINSMAIGQGIYQVGPMIQANTDYTVSFDIKAVFYASSAILSIGLEGVGSTLVGVPNDTNWRRVNYTVNTGNIQSGIKAFVIYGTTNDQQAFYITNIKLEKGNKLTDWTPAPQDVQDDIANAIDYIEDIRDDLQGQIDGQIESYFQQVDPTLFNYPAVDWNTEPLKQAHANDTYTNTSTGASWRWQKVGVNWEWGVIADTATQQALIKAGQAQDTADGKRRVFTGTPYPPYDIGDLWTQGASGDLKVAVGNRNRNESYVASDWVIATKYTNDAVANEAIRRLGVALNQFGEWDANFTTFHTNFGDLAYEDLLELAINGKTLIQGGLINTVLLDANAIKVDLINAQYINTLSLDAGTIKTGKLSADRIDVEALTAQIISAITITAEQINALDLTVVRGTIGGLRIENNSIHSENNKFKVTSDGVLTAVDGNFTGEINALNGTIGGWVIDPNRLRTVATVTNSTTPIMSLDSEGRINMYTDTVGNASWLSPKGLVMLAGTGEYLASYGFASAGFFRINGESTELFKDSAIALYSQVYSGYGWAGRFDGDVKINGNLVVSGKLTGNKTDKVVRVTGNHLMNDEDAVVLTTNDGIITFPASPVDGRTITINRIQSLVLRGKANRRIRIRGTVTEAGDTTENLWGATFTYVAVINEWVASGYLN